MNHPRATALQMTSPANFDDIEVVREFATSKDGTKIPISDPAEDQLMGIFVPSLDVANSRTTSMSSKFAGEVICNAVARG